MSKHKTEVNLSSIKLASKTLSSVVKQTELEFCQRLSNQYQCEVFLKREDRQQVRSFKIRGAYNLISNLTPQQRKQGVVCASAGNHAQGVAFSCHKLKVFGTIFMPNNTPLQKIERVKSFGGSFVKIQLVGQNYDESSKAAKEYAKSKNLIFAHPFDDPLTISGQGTIGLEILDQLKEVANSTPDYVLIAVGGGGLVAGVATAVKKLSKKTKIVAVEVDNQAGMNFSITQNKVTELPEIGTFVDGTAVKKVGELTFKIAKEFVDEFVLVSEGRVCTDMIELYQNEGIIAEPSGALAVSGLSKIADKIKSKKVVCIICGGNNDISRYPEVIEKSLVWKGLKHYFMVNFNQKPGELKKFLTRVLGSKDDIVLFEYIKKTNKEKGVAIVGIQLQDKKDYPALIARLKENQIDFQEIKKDDMAYKILI